MRIFVTGASGFVGSTVVSDLRAHGYDVIGLVRREEDAAKLRELGARPMLGEISDLDGLRHAARQADGVIHTAFGSDMSRFAENCVMDREAIDAMGSALEGSGRPLVVTSGLPVPSEDQAAPTGPGVPPRVSEQAALSWADRGVRSMVIRLPQVHDRRRQGAISFFIRAAQCHGFSAYANDGAHLWSAVHLNEVAPLYRLALKNGTSAARYHAVTEEGVAARDVAGAIGRGMGIPVVAQTAEEAMAHFAPLGWFAMRDTRATSVLTQSRLGWHPKAQPSLLDNVREAAFSLRSNNT